MKTITKKDLAQLLVDRLGCPMNRAKEFVDGFFDVLIDEIVACRRIEARGFGVFEVSRMNPRPQARNPRTGERVFVPARRKVRFKPGKALKKVLGDPRNPGE